MLKGIAKFFLSLRTASLLFLSLFSLCLIGSLSLPKNLAFFSGIDDTPLFGWLSGAGDISLTWWIYGMIFLLAALAASTIFCTAEALLKRMNRQALAGKLSPQVMHIGVLLIMLGHLLTASMGFKTDISIKKGGEAALPGGAKVYLEDVSVLTDQSGYDTDWIAKLTWIKDGKRLEGKVLRPASPLYFGRIGLYIKSASIDPYPSALIRVADDPGALWALVGGFLLVAGGLGFIYGRYRA